MNAHACCFTGHRELPADLTTLQLRLHAALLRLYSQGYTDFYSGGAAGFDLLAGEAVLDTAAQNALPLRLHLVLPYDRTQLARELLSDEQRRQLRLLRQAASVVTLSPRYYRGCFHVRNRYLVDHSSYCLCYLRQEEGGTAYTVAYAQKKGVPVENLASPTGRIP